MDMSAERRLDSSTLREELLKHISGQKKKNEVNKSENYPYKYIKVKVCLQKRVTNYCTPFAGLFLCTSGMFCAALGLA
ncbi:hypothetical protein Y032_0039g134 [Ancylostoma ceylanicum]|uniref:Uncharacterized protein n=1 Tax=Ancylostoma ceylanicum TaxID=53326 RepID=A0A016UJL2_9BILA|nr:hypothetical protein Y032_0039g134 [Ancylostoma ceylanicum]